MHPTVIFLQFSDHNFYYSLLLARSLGTREPMGHSDYYVNNANTQLGCPVNKSFSHVLSIDKTSLGQGEILPGCSHKRSFKYFIEAMESGNCTFLGLICDNFENFTMVIRKLFMKVPISSSLYC